MVDNARLERIEDKIDSLAQAMIDVARLEERTRTLYENDKKQDSVILLHANKISALEQSDTINVHKLRVRDRFTWVVISALVTVVITVVSGART